MSCSLFRNGMTGEPLVHGRCPFEGVDPVYLALSRLRRRKFDGAIEVATELLSRNALDQQVEALSHTPAPQQ